MNPKEKKEVIPEPPQKAWFLNGGALYLTVIDKTGEYWFCHGFTGKPIFQKQVEGVFPRRLQLRDGQPIAIVGVPKKEALAAAPVLSAHDLYTEINTHLRKYVDAPDIERELFIYYILYSWIYMKSNTSPYLRFIGDTGNGKTRMHKVCGDLCFYPVKAGGASSPSGIMRLQERWHGTLLVDEADLRDSGTTNELVKYLNLGFEKGQYFIKSDKDDPRNQDIFDPFSPKVIAMRTPFSDNATEGRLLSFSPRETRRKDLPILLPNSYDAEVEALQARIALFTMANFERVDGERLIDLSEMLIEPRLKQLALPLSIVLQLFPDGEERFREYMIERQKEIKRVRASSYEGLVFNSVLESATNNPLRMSPTEIAEITGLKTAKQASRVLHSIHFKTEVVTTDKSKRILVVPDALTWTGICQRYYYSDQTLDIPECPESLRSIRWVDEQQTL